MNLLPLLLLPRAPLYAPHCSNLPRVEIPLINTCFVAKLFSDVCAYHVYQSLRKIEQTLKQYNRQCDLSKTVKFSIRF